jgi:hypothetical protein
MGRESKDEYDERVRGYIQRYGPGNVLFASKGMVDWAGSGTLGRYFVNGVITAGVSTYQEITRDFERVIATNELPRLVAWLERKGLENAQQSAWALLTGRPHPWPFMKLELTVVRYSNREHPASGVATPWRHDNHLAYVIIWDERMAAGNPGPGPGNRVGRVPGQGIDPGQDRLDAMQLGAQGRLRGVFPPPNGGQGGPPPDAQGGFSPNGQLANLPDGRIDNQAGNPPGSQPGSELDVPPEGQAGNPPGNVPDVQPGIVAGIPPDSQSGNPPPRSDISRQGFFAPNLGITYVPVPLGRGTFGARLIRDPQPGSPAGQGGLESGDMIIELDGTPIRGPSDVINHIENTTIRLIDVRTNAPQDTQVFIPPPNR